MAEPISLSTWRALHGGVFLLCWALVAIVPGLGRWPWLWLVPILAYLAIVAAVPALRCTLSWFRVGRIDFRPAMAAGALMVATSGVLVLFHVTVRPDMGYLRGALPVAALGGMVTAGVMFAVINATLEELVFRGVLFDAIESQWGWPLAVLSTAVVFGLGHMNGYPPGPAGAFLAGLYGVALGLLRSWTGGLALPVVAHIAADATIYSILAWSGVLDGGRS